MLQVLITMGLLAMVFFNGCAVNEKKVHQDESNYTPSEKTIWNAEQK
ncbi:hypothetical protein [Helicobacter sp. 11S02596-1]|nr:hypothetical protein [Helicobacter sp. 11S02596-1]